MVWASRWAAASASVSVVCSHMGVLVPAASSCSRSVSLRPHATRSTRSPMRSPRRAKVSGPCRALRFSTRPPRPQIAGLEAAPLPDHSPSRHRRTRCGNGHHDGKAHDRHLQPAVLRWLKTTRKPPRLHVDMITATGRISAGMRRQRAPRAGDEYGPSISGTLLPRVSLLPLPLNTPRERERRVSRLTPRHRDTSLVGSYGNPERGPPRKALVCRRSARKDAACGMPPINGRRCKAKRRPDRRLRAVRRRVPRMPCDRLA